MTIRISVIIPMFNGIAADLEAGRWSPTGVPAIYRLLEGMAATDAIDLTVLVLANQSAQYSAFPCRRSLSIPGIGRVEVVPPSASDRRLARAWMHLRHFFSCMAHIVRRRPHLVYATNAAVAAAGITARLRLAPVVLRLMGVFPFHHTVLAETNLRTIVQRWFFRSPFAWVLCSMDGSGSSSLVPRLIPHAPIGFALNGVDIDRIARTDIADLRLHHGLDDRPLILFVGRLVGHKGAREFLDAAFAYLKTFGPVVQFAIVGDGSEAAAMRREVVAAGLESHIHMPGGVPHAAVVDWLAASVIYVSLNQWGNLSNANLEALASGCCMIWRRTDDMAGSAAEADALIPAGTVAMHDPADGPAALAMLMNELLSQPEKRAEMAAQARRTTRSILRTWTARMAAEIQVLQQIAKSGKADPELVGMLDTNPKFRQ
jgi:glycosyltransferase involved in cell wall biosynthesis